MGWRIIYIEMASRINYKLNSIGIIQKEEIVWINLDEIDDLDDIIIFKFYSRKIPNIMISNEIINIDLNLLSNQLLLNWPTNIENSKIENIVKRFLEIFLEKCVLMILNYILDTN